MDQSDIDKFKDFRANFPLLTSGNSEKLLPRRISEMAQIVICLETGETPNARLKEYRSDLGRIVEDAWTKLIKEVHVYGKYQSLPQNVQEATSNFTCYDLHQVGALVKKYEKAIKKDPDLLNSPMIQDIGKLLAEARVLFDAGVRLKETAVKREVKSDAEKEAAAKYVPPMADKNAELLVRGALEKIAEESHQEMISNLKSQYSRRLDAALEKLANGTKHRNLNHGEKDVLDLGADCVGFTLDRRYEKKPNSAEVIEKRSVKEADFFKEQFVIKNLRKLASVIDNKSQSSALTTVEEIGRRVSIGSLEGTLRMTFKDGSKFSVTNSVEGATSPLGKYFHRFPLRFHDAFNENGVKIKGASEEVMNNEFR